MLQNLSITSINKYISALIPDWTQYENESIFLELKIPFDELLNEKLNVIKVLKADISLFYKDPLFFLHSTEVINGNVTNFHTLPYVTSLEVAYAIVEVATFQGITVEKSETYSKGVRMTIEEVLKDDGYSYPVWPFTVIGLTGLQEGASKEDMDNKEKAIKEYINGITTQRPN